MIDYNERARRVKMVIFDVDGVLTDGKIVIGNGGELYKSFSAQDGLGISLLNKAGVLTAIITGRDSEIVAVRARELRIDAVYQGYRDKRGAYAELKERYGLTDEQIAYVGDDLIDLPVMTQVGLACAVGNAVGEVKSAAHFVSERNGGNGAVRSVVELILRARGEWEGIVKDYLAQKPPADVIQ